MPLTTDKIISPLLHIGIGDARGEWIDKVYLRKIGDPDAGPIELGTFTFAGDVQSGTSYTRRELLTLPKHIQGAFQIELSTNVGPL